MCAGGYNAVVWFFSVTFINKLIFAKHIILYIEHFSQVSFITARKQF